jgi:hypothetical protein
MNVKLTGPFGPSNVIPDITRHNVTLIMAYNS